MKRLEVSGAVRPIYGSLGVKRLSILSRLSFKIVLCSRLNDLKKKDTQFASEPLCTVLLIFMTMENFLANVAGVIHTQRLSRVCTLQLFIYLFIFV